MSRIDDLIAEYCPDGVKHQTLGEIGEFIRGNGIQKRDFQDSGFGCIHYGQIYTYYGLFTSIFFYYLSISPQMLEYPVFTDFF